MKTTAYGSHLIQLTRFPLLFPVNCYLVDEEDGLTLIDTGMAGSGRAILDAVKATGKSIVRIVLTHAHGDHAGSLDELHALLPNADVLVSSRTARFLSGDLTLDPDEPQTKLRGGYVTRTTRPTRLISSGERIGSLDVIAAPGHSPDQVAFLDRRDRTLIVGDAFQTRGGIAVSGTVRPLFPFPAMATWHKPTALASAQALRDLNPSRLAVGHGAMLENPVSAMDGAIAVAARGQDLEVVSAG